MSEILLKPLKAGLIGSGIQASLTPAMHMKEGAAQGLDYDFELIDLVKLNASPADLSRLIADAKRVVLPASTSPIPVSSSSSRCSTTCRPKPGRSAPSIPSS